MERKQQNHKMENTTKDITERQSKLETQETSGWQLTAVTIGRLEPEQNTRGHRRREQGLDHRSA